MKVRTGILAAALAASVAAASEDPFAKAEEFFSKGKFEMAALFYNRALEAKPDNGRAYFNRGRIRLHQGDYAAAIADFRRYAELEPRRTEVHYYLGCAYALAGQGEEAVRSLERVPPTDRNYPAAVLNLGHVHLALRKDRERTIASWERFLELRPDDEQAETIRKAVACLKDPACWESVLASLERRPVSGTNAGGSIGGEGAAAEGRLPDFFVPPIEGEGTKAEVSKPKGLEGKKGIQTD